MPYVLYRAIKGKGARVSDFWSDFAFGEEPFRVHLDGPHAPLEWAGVSTFIDLTKARAMAIRWRQGHFLVELRIPDDADAIVRQTGRQNPTHYSVMATPRTLLSYVAQVLPITDESPS